MTKKSKPNINEAASALGKRSADARKKKWGTKAFRDRMREYGKLGGRPKKTQTDAKKGES
jgi:hypothetical protein